MTVAAKTEEVTVVGGSAAGRRQRTPASARSITSSPDREPAPQRPAVRATWPRSCPASASASTPTPRKSTQFAPQVAGGGGRNINYLIDGGDNNDDTVGGLIQLFPLDSIGEFNFETQRFRADTGRANGGTIKVVTKSGTNELHAARVFELFRDKSAERLSAHGRSQQPAQGRLPPEPVRRQPRAGRSCRTRPTSSPPSSARSRTPAQAVNTRGLYPDKDGSLRAALSREPGRGQADAPAQHRATTCPSATATTDNSQPYGASPSTPPENLGHEQEHVPLRQREPQLRARQRQAQRVHLPVLVLPRTTSARTRRCPPSSTRTA